MKIAIAGRMASGKTTMANWLVNQHQYHKVSLAAKVKEIAHDLFGMEEKDRPLLQQIGMKMREIRPSVWIDYVIDLGNHHENIVIDDVRFVNEAKALTEAGWKVVRLVIDEDLQKERLQTTYADWETHWANREDISESEVDLIPEDYIWLNVDASYDNYQDLF